MPVVNTVHAGPGSDGKKSLRIMWRVRPQRTFISQIPLFPCAAIKAVRWTNFIHATGSFCWKQMVNDQKITRLLEPKRRTPQLILTPIRETPTHLPSRLELLCAGTSLEPVLGELSFERLGPTRLSIMQGTAIHHNEFHSTDTYICQRELDPIHGPWEHLTYDRHEKA